MAKGKKNLFERFANWATAATGSSAAFIIAICTILVWLVTGPIFNYSDTWQLIINTGTTIITFLMVFLIQKTQNKDSKAIHLKLNELLASHQGASNRMVVIEDLTEKELDQLHKFYVQLSDLAEKEDDITCTHSIDAAEENHESKLSGYRSKPHYQHAIKNRSKAGK
ncbi:MULTISPECIES: low affinity iron permease family protein [unclassified Mucilaginibacter]|uniref:low affinity iron permease family protein n=1 Tax=unclassified Mucilaginibacter TaxID=2617802 RepID=UPI002AC89B01|nr:MULTISPECIES: low affinity iron permease family protein [unclassified Mucilaginibacter]MEB0263645.1 low affinity iron permease family protein [Mucilaginibacter sp. 10I4]MEB0277879.1 low affinity iron permease family protein [Mucilaginibacter sp. 10B2]MEB0300574.1 low affinity iron permease family protein [Mucilaginibacter sp. 5C4]WPX22771.1 low affinity iron permease family protein [Mucilaginibacter sp. 5C4]